jgi:hypothetical protein
MIQDRVKGKTSVASGICKYSSMQNAMMVERSGNSSNEDIIVYYET